MIDPATDDGGDAVAGWIRANAHRLRTLDPDDDDFSDLEPLREIVGDARVVCVGESMHRVHEFYQIRHRVLRFLVAELGFGALVMESGFAEGLAVDAWVRGGPGDLDDLLNHGITYHMGKCAEMRGQLEWMRAYNAAHERPVRFYGMDVPGAGSSSMPAVEAGLPLLEEADPAYAEVVRTGLLPLYGYLPADRSGIAYAAPALQAYMALPAAHRHELTARIAALTDRLRAMRVTYTQRVGAERAELAHRCAVTARHMDAFQAAMAVAEGRTYEGANLRDMGMAETIEWILRREDRVVVAAANGHVQREPFLVPPFVNQAITMLGEHLTACLGEDLVIIATAFGGGSVWLHKPGPDSPPGHSEPFVQELGPNTEADSLDAIIAAAGLPLCLLDLRTAPARGPVADRLAAANSIMHGPHPQLLDPMNAFDAVVYVDEITPWHTTIPTAAAAPL